MAECGSLTSEFTMGSVDRASAELRSGFMVPEDVSAEESAALGEAEESYRTWLRAQLVDIYVAGGGERRRTDGLSLKDLREAIERDAKGDERERFWEALIQTIADERAGFVEPPADLSALEPLERLTRLDADQGEALHRFVAAELGEARATELHLMFGRWPNSGTTIASFGSCPGAQ
jgi:hypothetical protein